MENNIATADDFRAAAEAEAYDPEHRVVLPKCGLAIIVRRPRALAYALVGVQLPQSLAAKISSAKDGEIPALSDDELIALNRRFARILISAIVRPKFSFDPGAGEVSPAWLPTEDQTFLARYIQGEVDELNHELSTFRSAGQPRSVDSGADSAGVGMPPERATDEQRDAFPV